MTSPPPRVQGGRGKSSVPSDSATNTGTLIAAIGAGTASLLGGTTGSFSSGDANGEHD